MTKIKKIYGIEVLDSRANPTLMTIVELENGIKAKAYAPSGASKGNKEAIEIRDGEKRLNGLGIKKAIKNIELISKKLKGNEITEQEKIDQTLIELDGTTNMARLGANTTVSVSLACIKAAALSKKKEVYQLFGCKILPIPFMNVINGGVHAGNELSIQEFMIVPKNFKKFNDALWAGVEVYHILKNLIKQKYGKNATNLGDEGGFAPPLKNTKQAIELLESSIEESGYKNKIFIGLDAAANSFFNQKEQKYFIDGKKMDSSELLEFWIELIKSHKIISIEDPFEENSSFYFAELKKRIKNCQVVADDLTVSNLKLVKRAIAQNALHTLLLKVNQIGTLSQAIETAKYCIDKNIKVMISHRSGETEDNVLADLGVGLGFGMIKTGAPARGERTAKYNRLLEIENQLGKNAKFSKVI
ncbi:MAG: phosphopyruvate hydratase [Candidatus Anstonellaceae archaeon]